MIRFLDPAFLLGLLAIAVPVVLHLLFRRRVPLVAFPLVRLLERAERTQQPRKRLNRVLLLVARSLMLALLALALARTTLGPGVLAAASGPQALVVVLDDSLSMQARDDSGRTGLERAKERADERLAALPDGSFAALVVASRPQEGEAAGLSSEIAPVRERLAAVGPTSRRLTLAPSLAAALRVLSGSPLPARSVALHSDMARHAFETLQLDPLEGAPPELVLDAASPPGDRTNRSLAGLDVRTLPDGRLGLATRVASWGGGSGEVPVEIRLGPLGQAGGDMRLAGRAEVASSAGATAERRFELAPPGGGYVRVRASLEEDFLAADDVREIPHHVARRPAVLVVDGDPQNLSFGSETFYLERALARDVGLDFDAEIVTLAELGPEQLRDRDTLVLCNAPELTEERAAALADAVAGGMGLVVALGNRVDQRVYNGRLAELLPATVSLPRRLETPQGVEVSGPMPALPRVGVTSLFTLEPDPGARVLARLSDGSPLLVAGRFGAGHVLLWASTLDRDWTDLPISPHFLAFLRGLVESVASPAEGRVLPQVAAGDAVALGDLREHGATRLRSPSGRVSSLEQGDLRPEETGAWTVEDDAGEIVGVFAVVTDPAESDLARHSAEEVASIVGPALRVGGVAGQESGALTGGLAAWKGLLVALVALALAESWLSRSVSR